MNRVFYYNTYNFQHPDTGVPIIVELNENEATGEIVVEADLATSAYDGQGYDADILAESEALVHRLNGRKFSDETAVRKFLIYSCGVSKYDL